MRVVDSLPPEVRAAIRECPFYIEVSGWNSKMSPEKAVNLIRSVRSLREAHELSRNLGWAARSSYRSDWGSSPR